MAKRAILYIDLLGVQKKWSDGGARAVKNRITEFHEFVLHQFNYLPSDLHRDGDYTVLLSGDSVSVLCIDPEQAVGIGSHLFMQAFYATNRTSQPFWLRGAISAWNNQNLTVNSERVQAKEMNIGTAYVSEDDYLAVLALEKSGFKGMRLILSRDLLRHSTSDFSRDWPSADRPLFYVSRLRECNYPTGEEYADVLWMTETEDRYNDLKNIMASRFKKCTGNNDEFLQASWTRVVFDQVDTLIWFCRHPVGVSTPAPIVMGSGVSVSSVPSAHDSSVSTEDSDLADESPPELGSRETTAP